MTPAWVIEGDKSGIKNDQACNRIRCADTENNKYQMSKIMLHGILSGTITSTGRQDYGPIICSGSRPVLQIDPPDGNFVVHFSCHYLQNTASLDLGPLVFVIVGIGALNPGRSLVFLDPRLVHLVGPGRGHTAPWPPHHSSHQ